MSRIDIIKQDDGSELIKYNFRAADNQPLEILNPKSYTVCGAWIKEKEKPCTQPAGKKTDHIGWGRCYMHGGSVQSPISQRNQKKAIVAGEINYPGLQEEVERLYATKDVFDLRDEIFTILAICKEVMKKAEDLDDLTRAVPLIERATRVSQRLHEIEEGRRLVVSVQNINSIIEAVVEVVDRHVSDQYTKYLIGQDLAKIKIGSGFPRAQPKPILGEVIETAETE